ncbi:MAG: hypothetical protein ACI857_002318 [Arenicella sp.]|jgi:hypothetical protein
MRPNDYLNKGNRKQVYHKTFYSIDEVARGLYIIQSLLKEANHLDK